MAKRVYKLVIPVDDREHVLELTGPIVHIAVKGNPYQAHGAAGEFCIWYEDGARETVQKRPLRIFGTGQEIDYPAQHVGSAVDYPTGLVWHLYERKS